MTIYRNNAGYTLIELIVAFSVLAILAGVALPSFQVMFSNMQTKNAAEALVNGLQKARAEAVSRNTNVEFVLGAGTSWQVLLASDNTVLDARRSEEGSSNANLDALNDATMATFGSLGTLVRNEDDSDSLTQLDVDSEGGDRPLRILVGASGSVKMCDPNLTAGTAGAC